MLSFLTVFKLAALVGSSAGIWGILNDFPVPKAKRKIKAVFRLIGKGFPEIEKVTHDDVKTFVRFKVPKGMNPADITKHHYLFEQMFGEHIELVVTPLIGELKVYFKALKSFKYEPPVETKGIALPIYAGRTQEAEILYDMKKFPHLLIAGVTGAGKSSIIRSILTTLIMERPKTRFILGDLKRTEFHVFRGVQNCMVITKKDALLEVLRSVRDILDSRGDEMDSRGLTEWEGEDYIICIDEVSRLKGEKEAREIIDEIGAVGRALGVYLILSTQRPDAEIIDGRLKSNMTVRIALRHLDELNSRITIDRGDAASIGAKENGRFVMLGPDGFMQGFAPWLSVEECRRLLKTHIQTKDEDWVKGLKNEEWSVFADAE